MATHCQIRRKQYLKLYALTRTMQATTHSSVTATAHPACAPHSRGFMSSPVHSSGRHTLPHKCASSASEQRSEMFKQHNENRCMVGWTMLPALLLLTLSVRVTTAHSAMGYLTLGRRVRQTATKASHVMLPIHLETLVFVVPSSILSNLI